MNRAQLEHVIRAASAVADDPDIVVLGTGALLGTFPAIPDGLVHSLQAEIHPRHSRGRSEALDRALGPGSEFHDAHGCSARVVDPEAAVLAEDWEARLVAVVGERTGGATGWCLEPHDAVASHLVGGRDPEVAFVAGALRANLVEQDHLADRIRSLGTTPVRRDHALSLLTLSAARSVLAGH